MGPDAVDPLLRSLDKGDPACRPGAAWVLGKAGSPVHVPAILRAAAERQSGNRLEVFFEAAYELDAALTKKWLFSFLTLDRPMFRLRATEFLAERVTPEDRPRIDGLVNAPARQGAVRIAGLELLSRAQGVRRRGPARRRAGRSLPRRREARDLHPRHVGGPRARRPPERARPRGRRAPARLRDAGPGRAVPPRAQERLRARDRHGARRAPRAAPPGPARRAPRAPSASPGAAPTSPTRRSRACSTATSSRCSSRPWAATTSSTTTASSSRSS